MFLMMRMGSRNGLGDRFILCALCSSGAFRWASKMAFLLMFLLSLVLSMVVLNRKNIAAGMMNGFGDRLVLLVLAQGSSSSSSSCVGRAS